MAGPLQGIRVLDLTTVVMGPYACQLMGDYGADVIKVEPPDGDVMRLSGPMKRPGMGHLFLSTNRSKRSIVIDLKTPEGREPLLRLAKQTDVLLYNIRPQAMARLGVGYEDLRAVNPRLVYVGALGFSQRGPYRARPAYDDLIQRMSGIPWLSLKAGSAEPRYAPVILADRIVGLQVAFAAMAALRHRDVSGEGQRVDVPMFENLLTIVLGEHLAGSLFEPAIAEAGYQRSLAHNRRPHRTLDGYICTLVYTDKHWRSFFAAIGQSETFERDGRFQSSRRGEHRPMSRRQAIPWGAGSFADQFCPREFGKWPPELDGPRDRTRLRANGLLLRRVLGPSARLGSLRRALLQSSSRMGRPRPRARLRY
jgi:crotonobetainyl-CoA:carnitine CoA-transferase CaiB-like acyl-CoA transferase